MKQSEITIEKYHQSKMQLQCQFPIMSKETFLKAREYLAQLDKLSVRYSERELNEIIQFLENIPKLNEILKGNVYIKDYVQYAREDFQSLKKLPAANKRRHFKSAGTYIFSVLNYLTRCVPVCD